MKIKEILEKYNNQENNIIPILTEIQAENEYHYISEEAIKEVASSLNISESKIYSVISFYTHLSCQKQGKNIIQVCASIACHINNSLNILENLKKELEITEGETTKDELFTLETCSCLGCCDKSPVIRINKKIYENLSEEKIKEIINAYRRGENL